MSDITGLPRLRDALREAGYDEESINKMPSGNWLRVLEATWWE